VFNKFVFNEENTPCSTSFFWSGWEVLRDTKGIGVLIPGYGLLDRDPVQSDRWLPLRRILLPPFSGIMTQDTTVSVFITTSDKN
jgi:hypothetical protein